MEVARRHGAIILLPCHAFLSARELAVSNEPRLSRVHRVCKVTRKSFQLYLFMHVLLSNSSTCSISFNSVCLVANRVLHLCLCDSLSLCLFVSVKNKLATRLVQWCACKYKGNLHNRVMHLQGRVHFVVCSMPPQNSKHRHI